MQKCFHIYRLGKLCGKSTNKTPILNQIFPTPSQPYPTEDTKKFKCSDRNHLTMTIPLRPSLCHMFGSHRTTFRVPEADRLSLPSTIPLMRAAQWSKSSSVAVVGTYVVCSTQSASLDRSVAAAAASFDMAANIKRLRCLHNSGLLIRKQQTDRMKETALQ